MKCDICNKEFDYKPSPSIKNEKLNLCDDCMIKEVLDIIPMSEDTKKAFYYLASGLAEESRKYSYNQQEHTGMLDEFKELEEDTNEF